MATPIRSTIVLVLALATGVATLPAAASGDGSWGRRYGPPVQRHSPGWGAAPYAPRAYGWGQPYYAPRAYGWGQPYYAPRPWGREWRHDYGHRHDHHHHYEHRAPYFQPRGGLYFQFSN